MSDDVEPEDRGSQRVLIVLAAVILALFALVARRPFENSGGTPIADDPRLEVRIDLNTATAADLETLPGIGQSLAAKIVAYRAEHGAYRSVEDLQRIPGIGARLVEALRPLVAVR